MLLIGDENFFRAMAVLMSSYRETQLLSLIAWSCVQLLAPAVDLRLLRSRYDQGVILYRPYFCERFVETGYRLLVIALGSVSRFSRHERAAVSAKFDHLVTAATGLVNVTDWLDPASRQLAAEKLSSTRLQLWPPNIFLRNEELESVYAAFPSEELTFAEYWVQCSRRAAETYRTRTDIDILSYAVNYALPYLQYDAASGSVKVAVGAVSPPLYYSDGNKAMFFGGLGFSMAVQLVASLDRQGLRWHPDGTFGDSFLSKAAYRAFEDRDGCLEAAESRHGYPTRNGSRTSVFPEIPALEVAYAAYRRIHQRRRRRETAGNQPGFIGRPGVLHDPVLHDVQPTRSRGSTHGRLQQGCQQFGGIRAGFPLSPRIKDESQKEVHVLQSIKDIRQRTYR
ncbi:hypothetical protein MTO96_029873 [Rhipicephalus appendiculatus]